MIENSRCYLLLIIKIITYLKKSEHKMDSENVIYYFISQQRLLKRTLCKVCLLNFKTQRPPCEILLRNKVNLFYFIYNRLSPMEAAYCIVLDYYGIP